MKVLLGQQHGWFTAMLALCLLGHVVEASVTPSCSQPAFIGVSVGTTSHHLKQRGTTTHGKGSVPPINRHGRSSASDSRLPKTSILLEKQSSHKSTNVNSLQIRLTSASKQAKANLIIVSKAIQSNWGFGPESSKIVPSDGGKNKWGGKGEIYVAAQYMLLFCAIRGKIPLLGSLISFLLGPALLCIGLATYYLAVSDFGFVESLSPWSIVVPSSTMLVSKKNGDEGKLLDFGVINGSGKTNAASGKFDRPLVTDGRVYSEMRHPIYAGLLYVMAGFSIWSGSAMRLLLTAALYYALDQKANAEEEELLNNKKFKKGYESYKDRVKGRFVPERYVTLLINRWKEWRA